VVKVFESDVMITALYGILDPRDRTWTYTSAGHVPAVVRRPDGTTRLLDDDSDPPLGAAATFRTRRVELPERASLVLYTDGLVERRSRSINDGLARLQQACATADPEPNALCDHILDALLEDRANEDDVAIVAVTLD
jgi:serine phosphatase RsbU (regulator of sigma subunit)